MRRLFAFLIVSISAAAGCSEKTPQLESVSAPKEVREVLTSTDPGVIHRVSKDVFIVEGADATTSDEGQFDKSNETGAVAVKAEY